MDVRALGIVLLKCPMGALFLMSEARVDVTDGRDLRMQHDQRA